MTILRYKNTKFLTANRFCHNKPNIIVKDKK